MEIRIIIDIDDDDSIQTNHRTYQIYTCYVLAYIAITNMCAYLLSIFMLSESQKAEPSVKHTFNLELYGQCYLVVFFSSIAGWYCYLNFFYSKEKVSIQPVKT